MPIRGYSIESATHTGRWCERRESAVSRDETISRSVSLLLILLLVSNPIAAQGDEPLIQADVYNALYEAYVQCDDHFGQSRSEFITEKLQLGSGRITVALLKKILSYKVEAVNQEIAQKSTERELVEGAVIGDHGESARRPGRNVRGTSGGVEGA